MGIDRTGRWLIIIMAAALVVRIGAILAIDDPGQVPRSAEDSDAPTYYVIADNIIAGNGYAYGADEPPTARRTPGYPLFIVSIFKVFGRDFNRVRYARVAPGRGSPGLNRPGLRDHVNVPLRERN